MVAIRLELIFLTMTRRAMIFPIKTSQYMRYLMGGFVDSTLFCYIVAKYAAFNVVLCRTSNNKIH